LIERLREKIAGSGGDGVIEDVGEQSPDGGSAETDGTHEPRLDRGLGLDLLVGGFALAVYLTVQLWVLQGPRPFDNALYLDAAVDFPDISVNLWTLRIGLIGLVRLGVLAFGPSEAALYAVPIGAGLLLTAAVYGTMLLLFRDRVLAAAAALVTVLSNVFLFISSYIYPDTAATATLTAGFFFLVLAGLRTEGGDDGWLPPAAVVCAGMLFGLSFLIREFSPFLLPAVVVAVVLLRFSWRRVALLAGVAIAMASLELVYGAVRYGKPFIHLEELLGRNTSSFSARRGTRMDYIQSQLDTVFDTILVGPRLVLSWRTGWLFLLLVVIFLVALVLVRDRRFWLLASWCISFWVIMVLIGLGELPSGRWILNITNVRYWYPILPAVVMASFGGLWLLLRRWFPTQRGVRLAQASAAALAVVILVPGVAEFRSCAATGVWRNDPATRWHDFRSWIEKPAAQAYEVIWTDYQTHRLVPVYTAAPIGRRLWDGEAKQLPLDRPPRPTTDPSTTLILVHKPRLLRLAPEWKNALYAMRSEWTPVFVSDDGEMVLLAHEPTPDPAVAAGEWWNFASTSDTQSSHGRCGRSPYERR
jgi:hypothetical protein